MLRNRKSLIALMLSFVLLISSLPASATGLNENQTEAQIMQPSPVQANNADEILSVTKTHTSDELVGGIKELTDLRDENVKHFRLTDGTYQAIAYAHPVHRKNKDGVWQDIDNTLALTAEKTSQRYSTPDSRVSFADYATANKDLFVLNENGYSISMKFVNSPSLKEISATETAKLNTAEAPIVKNAIDQHTDRGNEDIQDIAKIDNKCSITYNNVDLHTNIEYVLIGNDIKENIIVTAKREDYKYAFQLNVTGLIAKMDEAGNIRLYDIETNQSKYCIPAPYMYDNEGAYSNDVFYELQMTSAGVYTITVIADKTWINAENRAFPVTIDPTLALDRIVKDSFTYSSYPNAQYGASTELWISDTCTTFISIQLPTLPTGATLNDAYLYVYYYYNAGIVDGRLQAGAYQVLSSWNDKTITYNNAPTVSTSQMSTALMFADGTKLVSSPGLTSFNISSAARKWFTGENVNYGVALKRENNSTAPNQSVILKSYESGEYHAYISVYYTYYIPEGVYALTASAFSNSWLTIEDDSPFAGKKVQQTSSEGSPASSSVFDRSCLFKISQKYGNNYVIRSMLNNNLSFGVSNGEIITKTIPSVDSDVDFADTFLIEWDGGGFLLRPNGSSDVIQVSSAATPDLTTVPKADATVRARWSLVQYTGVHRASTTLYFAKLFAGVTSNITPIVWSTRIGYNTPEIEVKAGYDDYVTLTWDATSQRATVVPHEQGQFVFTVYNYKTSKYYDSESYDFTFNIYLLLDEGTHFFQNVQLGKYMQVNNNDKPNYSTNGAIMELWDFDGKDYQKMNLTHVIDGYYKICPEASGLALTAPSSVNSAITQTTYTGADSQLWKITSNGTDYTLSPKSNLSYYMAAGNGFIFGNDRNVEMRAAQSDNKDRWKIYDRDISIEFFIDYGLIEREKLDTETFEEAYQRISREILQAFERASSKFRDECDLIIKCDQEKVALIYSDADLCPYTGHDTQCQCVDECLLQWDQDPNENNNSTGFSCDSHCENIARLRNNLIVDIPENTIRFMNTGHNACYSNGEDCGFGVGALSDYDYPIICSKNGHDDAATMAHEISHLLGVEYHHSNPLTPPCIMNVGYTGESSLVQFWWCDECRENITTNRHKFWSN